MRLLLIRLRGNVEAIHDPRVIFLQLKQARPGGLGFHRPIFFVRPEINRSASPGIVGARAPLGRDDRRVVTIFARSHETRMLVQLEGNLRFERQAGALQDDLGAEFVAHSTQYTNCIYLPYLLYLPALVV